MMMSGRSTANPHDNLLFTDDQQTALPPANGSSSRIARVCAVFAIALLAGSVGAFGYSFRAFRGAADRLTESQGFLRTLLELDRSIVRLESSRRGYAVTQDPLFLSDYHENRIAAAKSLDEFQTLARSGERFESAAELAKLFETRLQNLDHAVRLADEPDELKRVTQSGREIAEKIETVMAKLNDAEIRLLYNQQALVARVRQMVLLFGIGGQLLAAALFGVSALLYSSQRKLREQSDRIARDVQRLLASILHHSPFMICVKNSQGQYLLVSREFERLTRHRKNEIMGKTDAELWPAEFAKQMQGNDRLAFQSEAPLAREDRIPFGDTIRIILTNRFRIDDFKGESLLCIMGTDISARSRAQQDLAFAYEKVEKTVTALATQNEQVSAIKRLGDELQSCMELEEAYAVIGATMERLFPGSRGAVAAIENSRRLVEVVAKWGEMETPSYYESRDCMALRAGKPHSQTETSQSQRGLICKHWKQLSDGTAAVCIPMIARGETVGVLHAAWPEDGDQAKLSDKITLATTAAELIALSLANLKLQTELRELSSRDPLTGLFNRRYAEETLERELLRAARERITLSIVSFDIDHFKRFNDTFGHSAGDKVLQEFAGVLRALTRASDVACRFGGEEFMLIMLGASREKAFERAESVREAVKHLQVEEHGKAMGTITVSAGTASTEDVGPSREKLFLAADRALYLAKASGRDRVEQAHPDVKGPRQSDA